MTGEKGINLVTGAFSYSGQYIARELLKTNNNIRTLTGHPNPQIDFYDRVEVFEYNFNDYEALVTSLRGVTNFINTYWIRFPRGDVDWEVAIKNSEILFKACKEAGVRKIIHISVTNPSLDSPYPYFSGKAEVEEHLKSCGVDFIIIRPTLIFADGDILLNNMAYLLRKFPVFGIFGSGKFKIQPISQNDLAEIIVQRLYPTNSENSTNSIINAIGPETHTFKTILRMLNSATNSRTLIIPFPRILKWIPFMFSKLFGLFLKDTLLTRHEIGALSDNLLLTDSEPLGITKFSDWLEEYGSKLGKTYAHEIKRHYECF